MWDLLELLALAFIPAFLLLDLVLRQKQYETPRFWRLRGLLVTLGNLGVSIAVQLFWGNLLGDFHLLDGGVLGIAVGAVVGVLVYELIHYGYHYAAHQYDWLWRLGHQMHHSAESLDAFGAYYMHPVDMALFTTWGSLVFFPLLGILPEAGIIATVFLAFNAMFQHANLKTPRWLGYLIQRPESHSVHHARGMHRYNYSDLPVWDILFGTFRNPAEFQEEQGFYKGASARIGEMLIFRDVSTPVSSVPRRGSELALTDELGGARGSPPRGTHFVTPAREHGGERSDRTQSISHEFTTTPGASDRLLRGGASIKARAPTK